MIACLVIMQISNIHKTARLRNSLRHSKSEAYISRVSECMSHCFKDWTCVWSKLHTQTSNFFNHINQQSSHQSRMITPINNIETLNVYITRLSKQEDGQNQ